MVRILTHMLQATAEKHPDRVAFKSGEQVLSYNRLLERSSQLANVLIESGVKPGDRVGIYLDRCLETSMAVYGILLAGAVFVPLDPSAPTARTQFLLQDCSINCLVTRSNMAHRLGKILTSDQLMRLVVGVHTEVAQASISWDQLESAPTSLPKIEPAEEDLAYIMYTSGSTGLPKGIMHTHYSGFSYAKLSAELYKITENDIVGGHAPLHFDISTMAYLTVPLVGAASVIISDAHTKLPVSLSQLMEHEKLTIWYSVPLALIQMMNNGLLETRSVDSLRLVLYGGEPFPPKYLKKLMHLWPNAQFCNVYGPAEVNQCTYYFIPEPPVDDHPISIGKVWPETSMMIVDEFDQQVAPGDQGELLIHSTTMMKGYWNNSALTEKSILVKETNGIARSFYKTGDLVTQDEQGNLHFLGRKDRQIKTRGYRVELETVEAALNELDEVREATVYARTEEPVGKIIEAAIIAEDPSLEIDQLVKNKLAERLPKYAIPTTIHQVASLPRTTSGKIDHRLFRERIQQEKSI